MSAAGGGHLPASRRGEAGVRRYAFVVHALSGLHRRIMGMRTLRPGLLLGRRDGTSRSDVAPLCRLRLAVDPAIEGVVVGIPMDPEQLLEDQERALDRMARAAALAGPVHAVGLGSLCAVVAGRGEALAERLDVPVTTGAAATAWALWENTRAVVARRGGPVAVVGANGPVGRAVATLLAAEGLDVRVDGRRGGRGLDVQVVRGPEVVRGCSVVVGAGPTGGTVPVEVLLPGAVVVDVALPATVIGRRPDVTVLAGEAVALPPTWRRGGWGWFYHLFAGYGPSQIFACLVEPLVLAATGRSAPYALGRRVEIDAVRNLGEAAKGLGFRPRLARGWFELPPERVPLVGRLRTSRGRRGVSRGGKLGREPPCQP